MRSKIAQRLTKEITDSQRNFVKLWGESLANYPQIRYIYIEETKTVEIPSSMVDNLPVDLLTEWHSKGYTVQTYID